MRRYVIGILLFAAGLSVPAAVAAECSTAIASTPSGSTFPCTVCVEGGRVVSIFCTPPLITR